MVQPTSTCDSWNACLNVNLENEDPEIFTLIEKEKQRQWSGLELIASEVSFVEGNDELIFRILLLRL
jgi:glycine hydroxymethyltransferase